MVEVIYMEVYYVQSKAALVINTILMLVVGALFIIDKDFALHWGFVVAGICLIISGIVPMIIVRNVDIIGIILIILGIVLCLIPNLMADITIVAVGVFAIIVGAIAAFNAIKAADKPDLFGIIVGALLILGGILTFMDNDIVFIVFGVILVIAGIVNVLTLLKSKTA